jgi:hypothetical protein
MQGRKAIDVLSPQDLAELRILVWFAQLDNVVAREEQELIEHLVAKILIQHLRIPRADHIAASLCNEQVEANDVPELVSRLDSESRRKRLLVLAERMIHIHRVQGEGPNGTDDEIRALEHLRDLIGTQADASTRNAIEGHALSGLLRGPHLAPLPSSLSRLRSDPFTKLIKPEGFCLKRMQWKLPIGRIPAWIGELGLLGTERHRAFYAFTPRQIEPRAGILLFPGGLVDFRAYARIARQLARDGLVVVVQNVPFGLALFDRDRALVHGGAIRHLFPHVKHWSVAGHSLGGVAAATYALLQPKDVDGLILWGSTPSPTHSLKKMDLPVMSLCGSEDGLVSPTQIENTRHLLPDQAKVIVVEGANHTQFGDYWDGVNDFYLQDGDRPAALSRHRQREQIVSHTVGFLSEQGHIR